MMEKDDLSDSKCAKTVLDLAVFYVVYTKFSPYPSNVQQKSTIIRSGDVLSIFY